MTQDEIISMARDGIQSYLSNGGFFNPEEMNHDKVRELIMLCRDALYLVAAHEREKQAELESWKHLIQKAHDVDGHCDVVIVEHLERFISKQSTNLCQKSTELVEIETAVLAEREACAKVCDEHDKQCTFKHGLAAAIRARGEK